MAAAVPLAQQGLDPGKVTLIHNGIYKLVITLSSHDTGQRLQLKTNMKGVGQGKRQAKPWLQEITAVVEKTQLLAWAVTHEATRERQPNVGPTKPTTL